MNMSETFDESRDGTKESVLIIPTTPHSPSLKVISDQGKCIMSGIILLSIAFTVNIGMAQLCKIAAGGGKNRIEKQ
ncbi:MAG: hypothetical protein FIB07_13260 [Candidatus Methanoperedens sp.]|nr:hypothetical protein [Candidatus Methanoperedens sp.]